MNHPEQFKITATAAGHNVAMLRKFLAMIDVIYLYGKKRRCFYIQENILILKLFMVKVD